MKKRTIVILVAVLAVLIAGVGWAKNYYDNRYVGQDYYAMVPVDEPIAINDLYDRDGNAVDKGYEYTITGWNESGESRELSFAVRTDSVDRLYAPGTFLRISASNQIVLNQTVIDRSQVPAEIVDKL